MGKVCLIKRGVTRIVFVFKNKVYKIPNCTYSLEHFLKGWIANIHEKKTWEVFNSPGIEDKTVRDKICPILKSYLKGFIIVMPRCTPLKPEDFPDESPFIDVPWGDHKMDNYGMLNGKMVCLDYGQ